MDLIISLLSSLTEPITFVSQLSLVLHIGNGIPQYLLLDKFQSFALDNQLLNLFSPVELGIQFICLFKETNLSLILDTPINHESRG